MGVCMHMRVGVCAVHHVREYTGVCKYSIHDNAATSRHACRDGVNLLNPRRCERSLVGHSTGLTIQRSSVRFRHKKSKIEKSNLHMDLNYIDPQARVLDYCYT